MAIFDDVFWVTFFWFHGHILGTVNSLVLYLHARFKCEYFRL